MIQTKQGRLSDYNSRNVTNWNWLTTYTYLETTEYLAFGRYPWFDLYTFVRHFLDDQILSHYVWILIEFPYRSLRISRVHLRRNDMKPCNVIGQMNSLWRCWATKYLLRLYNAMCVSIAQICSTDTGSSKDIKMADTFDDVLRVLSERIVDLNRTTRAPRNQGDR